MGVFNLALSSQELRGGEHLTNMKIFLLSYMPPSAVDGLLETLERWGVRHLVVQGFAGLILSTQRLTFGPHVSFSSGESLNETLAAELFDWSRNELVRTGYL